MSGSHGAGFGGSGELGNGQRQNFSAVPVPVAGNHSFVALNTIKDSYAVTCGVDIENRGWCWGTSVGWLCLMVGKCGLRDASLHRE